MAYDINANRGNCWLSPYQIPEDPCDDGKGIYFPRSAADQLAYLCIDHDTWARGLEQIGAETFAFDDTMEYVFRNLRCELYRDVGKFLCSVPYYTQKGGQLRLVCPPECLEKGPLKRKRKSRRVPKD